MYSLISVFISPLGSSDEAKDTFANEMLQKQRVAIKRNLIKKVFCISAKNNGL